VGDLDPAAVVAAIAADAQLRVFVRGGNVPVLPSKLSKRRLMLNEIAQGFQPGIRYPEQAVNRFLAAVHPDYAALRRYLVDDGFLDRAQGVYWRIGGTVPS
jgi:hypothetical protein